MLDIPKLAVAHLPECSERAPRNEERGADFDSQSHNQLFRGHTRMLQMTDTTRKIWAGVMAYRTLVFIVIYPVILVAVPLLNPGEPGRAAYILLLMAGYWLTEVIPIYVTALFPVFLAPVLGLIPSSKICPAYMKDTVMLFVGGLFVACTIEHRNLHRRIALSVLKVVGSDPKMLMLGVMLPTWFLSMWMSNTATTAMMITIVEAVIISMDAIEVAIRELNETRFVRSLSECLDSQRDSEVTEPRDKLPVASVGNQALAVEHAPSPIDSKIDPESLDQEPIRYVNLRGFNTGLSLAVCYASTCGGLATVTGTGPNAIFFGQVNSRYGEMTGLNFGSWMAFALPISILTLLVTWIVLTMIYIGPKAFCLCKLDKDQALLVRKVMHREYKKLGGFTYAEGSCCVLFALITSLWVTRNIGDFGWSKFFKSEKNPTQIYVSDSQPAMLIALLAMTLPAVSPIELWRLQYKRLSNSAAHKEERESQKTAELKNESLLPWHVVQKQVPWGIIFVLGGGFALSDVCQHSGLSDVIGRYLMEHVNGLPVVGLVAVFSILGAFFTELTSNAATISILLPILFSLSESMRIHPFLLTLPTTIATSFAFCLPAATPPNSIVFGRGRVRVKDMIKSGLFLNFAGCLITLTATITYAVPLFQMDTLPQWAVNITSTQPV
ncbi:Solute carrier 13 member 5 [Clonorchis sinensis]|uniref:Solute carrier 13 member 5 n=1 Tax=Clonorchis sinensis TaxID=79923 RepID=A0A3R7F505_CLOSI|nr:Solute carrier 13 member 5 [Clonorchis sinensis]